MEEDPLEIFSPKSFFSASLPFLCYIIEIKKKKDLIEKEKMRKEKP